MIAYVIGRVFSLTAIDAIRPLWFVAGIAALVYSIRKLHKARRDHEEHIETENGAVDYAGIWRIRSATLAVVISVAILGAALISVIDFLLPGPSRFGVWTIILLTVIPVLFAYKQIDDDRSHDLLLRLIRTRPNSPHRRTMDQMPDEDAPNDARDA